MPNEKHYWSGQIENDGRAPDLIISWANDADLVTLNGHQVDHSSVDRLIKNLKRARRMTRGRTPYSGSHVKVERTRDGEDGPGPIDL